MPIHSIELFSGAGGLALGLEQAGCRQEAMFEFNAQACDTIRYNVGHGQGLAKDWRVFEADVRDIRYGEVVGSVEMVAGGPPCQPFSLGGKALGRDDHRDMFPEAVRAVRELRPKCFVFENVKGLLRESFATYFNYIVLQLSFPSVVRNEGETWTGHLARLERMQTSGRVPDLAYRVVHRLLNAADYGIPQYRHRIFLVGFRADLGLEWTFPPPTHSLDRLLWQQWVTGEYWEEHRVPRAQRPRPPRTSARRVDFLRHSYTLLQPEGGRYRTVRDALAGLPDPLTPNHLPNHAPRAGARPYPGHTGSPLDEPSKALKAGAHGVPGGENMIAFPDGSYRYYTAREAARIQTFPDDYVFASPWTEAMRQIGNAVPVDLARTVGESILAQLEKVRS